MVLLAPAPIIQTVGYVRWLIIQMNGESTAAAVKTVVHESAGREQLAPDSTASLIGQESRARRLTARPRFLRSPVHRTAVLFIRVIRCPTNRSGRSSTPDLQGRCGAEPIV